MQAYAQDVSSVSVRSHGELLAVATPPLSHLDSVASAADTGDAASSLPSRYQSGGPETPPVSSIVQLAREDAGAAHTAGHTSGTVLQPVSYGAHTTMQPQLLASAFSAADDPPLLQQSWQLDALRKSGTVARPPTPPQEYGPCHCWRTRTLAMS